jgi:hypothetical protein
MIHVTRVVHCDTFATSDSFFSVHRSCMTFSCSAIPTQEFPRVGPRQLAWDESDEDEMDFNEPIIIPAPHRPPAISAHNQQNVDGNATSSHASGGNAVAVVSGGRSTSQQPRLIQAICTSLGVSLESLRVMTDNDLRQMHIPVGMRR